MPDYCIQHFRILCQAIVSVAVCEFCFLTSYVCADEPPARQSFAEVTQQLLNSSQSVAQTFSEAGISPKSILVQQQLINDLEMLLEQSGHANSTPEMAHSSRPQSQNAGEQGTSSRSQESEGSSTAGQAPTAELSPTRPIGELNQREKFADAVWGHLPLRERNDLLRTYSESYLPGYEDRVRRYFEKLAKLRHSRPGDLPKKSSLVDPTRP